MILSALSPLLRIPALSGLTRETLLKMDPETAHGATITALRLGLAPEQSHPDGAELRTSLCGLELTNPFDPVAVPQPVDMINEPTTDELFELMCAGSTVPLAEVKRHPHGAIFEQARSIVGPRSPDCVARLELADPEMLAELDKVSETPERQWRSTSAEWPFLLIARRNHHTTNASHQQVRDKLKKRYNPAFLHPDDMAALGVEEGDPVMVASPYGEIFLPVESDPDLRCGTVSISHGFGGGRMRPSDYMQGANVNRLLRTDIGSDPITGIPHMSAVPVVVRKVKADAADLIREKPHDLG